MKLAHKIILASNSPRRKELLSGLDVDYDIIVLPNIDESYPADLPKEQVAEYIAKKKALAYNSLLKNDILLITADTVVLQNGEVFGKPSDCDNAKDMLKNLSGKMHEVITGVCISSIKKNLSFSVSSEVRFAHLEDYEIEYYVSKYRPLDKAGAYGIQEWIGYIGIEYIAGSYFNIMGLPIQRLYQELKKF